MAAAAASRIRSSRVRRSTENKSVNEELSLNIANKDPNLLYKSTLLDTVNLKNNSATRRLSQLNFLIRCRKKFGDVEEHGIPFATFTRYLVVSLCDPCKEIRAAGFRVLRHFASHRTHCGVFFGMHVDFYLTRALDISLDNEIERIQAIHLIRKLMQLGDIPISVVNSLIGLASEGGEDRERMNRICLEMLCETLVLFPDHPCVVPVLRVLMEFLLTSTSLPLTAAVVAAVSHFSGKGQNPTAHRICDITQILSPITNLEGFEEDSKKESKIPKSVMVQAAKNAIVAALRSWEGIHLLTSSPVTGIESLIRVFFLRNQPAHEAIFDIITQLLFLPKDFESSLSPCDSWNLQENFVAAEAKSLLPHIGRTRMNVCANYLALLLFVFQQCRLVEGLVCVVTSQPNLHRRGLYLLNSFLSLASVYLPAEFTTQMQSLPVLVSLATTMHKLDGRVQGADAVADLFRFSNDRAYQQDTPRCMSIYLQHVLDICHHERVLIPLDSHTKELDIVLMKDSRVLLANENIAWNWQIITSILKADVLRANDITAFKFLHRLLVFYKPENKFFSITSKKHELARSYSRCGCYFVETLLREARDLLEELLTNLTRCLAFTKDSPGEDVIFNPLKLSSSCSSDYFIFVGKISAYVEGEKLLEKTHVFQLYEDLTRVDDIHESYVKLIITTLDYRRDGRARRLFEYVLAHSSPVLRRYATLHLRTLMRARFDAFSTWGMDQLLGRLQDSAVLVARTAVKIVDEACDEKCNLDALIAARPLQDLQALHPMAEFLVARMLGSPTGFEAMRSIVQAEMLKWKTSFNRRYVSIVEQQMNVKLLAKTSPERSTYRQTSSQSTSLPELFLPEHLFGQLVQHIDGCEIVRLEMLDLVEVIRHAYKHPILHVKAALWALGHVGRTVDGMAMLNEFHALDLVVSLVTDHDNLSVRGTTYFVLGLWSTTERGADLLKSRDWLAIRHHRHELWPIVDQRVHYTWDATSDWISDSVPIHSPQRTSRLISFAANSPYDHYSTSPVREHALSGMDGPAAHKTSRGESGFESSDGLREGDMDGMSGKDRSASAKMSDLSTESYGSPEDRTLEPSPTPDYSHEEPNQNFVRDYHRRSLFRMKSHQPQSFDEVRPRRSETRNSIRSLVNSVRNSKFLERKSSTTTPPATTLTKLSTHSSPTKVYEPSAKEEKFVGICIPLRRSIWRRPSLVPEPETLVNVKEDTMTAKAARRISRDHQDRSGLELHSVSNCIVCCVVGRDLSKAPSTESPIVKKRKEILQFVGKLATPLGHKAAEQGLLQLKNQLADSFLDPCLYSEVCHILSTFSFKLSIRRLIQELFLDVPLQKTLMLAFEEELAVMEANNVLQEEQNVPPDESPARPQNG